MTSCEDSRWGLFGRVEPLRVEYEGGIALHALAVFSDGGGGLELTWETDPENETVFAVSFRLYSTDDERVFQQGTILWNQFTGNTSSRGHPRQFRTLALFDYPNAAPFLMYDQTIPLNFPHEMPPGEYALRLVVYDADTLQETVELGTWKSEVGLARLRYSP